MSRGDAGVRHRLLAGLRRNAVGQHGRLLRDVVAPLELETDPVVGPGARLPGDQDIVGVRIGLDIDCHDNFPEAG